jgi:hypothetical protein
VNSLLIYTESLHPRTRYIIETMLHDFQGLNFVLTDDSDLFMQSDQPRFTYLNNGFDGIPNIFNSQIIETNDIFNPTFTEFENFVLNKLHVESDVFAFCFFMLSRAEEYHAKTDDHHGRYPAAQSYAVRNNFLHLPVVDKLSESLYKWLRKLYPSLIHQVAEPKALLTFDIDIAYAFKARPFLRQAGAILKDFSSFNFQNFNRRLAVLTGKLKDPFDVYDYLEELAYHTEIPLLFFFHVRSGGKYDRSVHTEHKDFVKLVKRISEFAITGIHPSYSGGQDVKAIIQEKRILEEITGKEIIHSRQHFLKLRMPQTARALSEAGILYDFSMGYAETPGWRAGTCKPFRLYDLEKDEIMPLTTYPLAIMDGTLGEYLALSPEEALKTTEEIMTVARHHGGVFIPLWHNETISNTGKWTGWKAQVFEPMIESLSIKFPTSP